MMGTMAVGERCSLLLLNSRVPSSPRIRIEEGAGHVERRGLVCRPVIVKD